MKRTPIVSLLCCLAASAFAQEYRSTFAPIRSERWWGLSVTDTLPQPFSTPFQARITGRSGNVSPMLVSSEGRYLWSDSPATLSFDGNAFTIFSDTKPPTPVKEGKTLRDAFLICCHRHFPPSGQIPDVELYTKPIYSPEEALGMDHTQAGVLSYAAQILSEGLPAGTLLIPAGWQGEEGLSFDHHYYPDPAALAADLHKMGFRLMLTVSPFIPASGRQYVKNLTQGGLLPGVSHTPTGYYACLDLSRQLVADGFRASLAALRTLGVDGFLFQTSGLEQPSPAFMANYLALANEQALTLYEGVDLPPASPCLSAVTPTGAGWDALSGGLGEVTALPLCGITYTALNLPPAGDDPALVAASICLAATLPVTIIRDTPWKLTGADYQRVKNALHFKEKTGEYTSQLIREAAKSSEPIARVMEYQFPRNGFSDCRDQFMIGTRYLVAPALSKDEKLTVRLPKGIWEDQYGKRYKGPMVISVSARADRPAIFESK